MANNDGSRPARVWPVPGFRLDAFRVPDPQPPTWLREMLLSRESRVDEKGKRFRSRPLTPVAPAFGALPDPFDCFLFTLEFLELPRASSGRPSGRLDGPTVPILRPQVVAGWGKPFLHLRDRVRRIDRSIL